MNRRFVDTFYARNYGCIRDLQIELTPLHALIGPNDSGKSTVLAALRTLTLLAARNSPDLQTPEAGALRSKLEARLADGETWIAAKSGGTTWRVRLGAGQPWQEELFDGAMVEGHNKAQSHVSTDTGSMLITGPDAKPLAPAVAGSFLLRLDPDALRQQAPLIPDGRPLRLVDARGTGLPGIYDAILARNMAAFLAISKKLSELFPAVESLSLKNPTTSTKALGVKLKDGTFVPAEAMSEGLLYYLAFATLPYLEPVAMVLVEEPENGLHPARIAEVMRVLREVSTTTQVIIATHSPLVVNELQPEEVTVLTRGAELGTRAVRIDKTPGFAERARTYALGELWVSYCNGADEGPLLNGGPRP